MNQNHDPKTGEFSTGGASPSLATRTAAHVRKAVSDHGVAVAEAAAAIGVGAVLGGPVGAARAGIGHVISRVASRTMPSVAPLVTLGADLAVTASVSRRQSAIKSRIARQHQSR